MSTSDEATRYITSGPDPAPAQLGAFDLCAQLRELRRELAEAEGAEPPRSAELLAVARGAVEELEDAPERVRDAAGGAATAYWAADATRLARAAEVARWALDAARDGRAAAGAPPWAAEEAGP